MYSVRLTCGLNETLEISPSCPTSVCVHTPVIVLYSLCVWEPAAGEGVGGWVTWCAGLRGEKKDPRAQPCLGSNPEAA